MCIQGKTPLELPTLSLRYAYLKIAVSFKIKPCAYIVLTICLVSYLIRNILKPFSDNTGGIYHMKKTRVWISHVSTPYLIRNNPLLTNLYS